MNRRSFVLAIAALLASAPGAALGQAEPVSQVFNAPADRVWAVSKSVLTSLGWKVDKEDQAVGWILTDSRRVEGDNFGVYAKGTKQRLRLTIKGQDAGRTAVSVDRRVWREERILWMDKEEEVPTSDRTVERQVLDAIARGL